MSGAVPAVGEDVPGLLAGELRAPGPDGIEVFNPARREQIVARVPATTTTEAGEAVAAAASALEEWRRRPAAARAEVLRGGAAWLRERVEAVAAAVSAEMGKTIAEARVETERSTDFLDFYAGLSRAPDGELLADARPRVEVELRAEPVGVVVAITPWNDPLLTPARKLAPALFAGNTVAIKPASDTPVSALLLARALHEGGAPAGIVNTVTGPADELVAPLLEDDRIAAVTFTGSTSVGLDLQRRLAGRNIRLQTEMGGKNPAVVLADADVEAAARTIAAAAFGQAGQRCTATSRVIADAAIVDELLELLSRCAAEIVVGAGEDPATTMGPLVSERQLRMVLEAVDRARREGAELVFGTGRLEAGPLADGWFVSPYVFAAVEPSMALWREEVFGPVLAVRPVDGLTAAIAAANDSDYGLAAALFTRDLAAQRRFAAEVEVGQVAVNLPTTGWDVHLPFGGWKLSGSPFKEQGVAGLGFYTRLKTVAVDPGPPA